MKIFKVVANEINFLEARAILANSLEEAREEYMNSIECGNIKVVKNEYIYPESMQEATETKSVIVNVNLEIKTPFITDEEAEQFAIEYELPKDYVEGSFEIVKTI